MKNLIYYIYSRPLWMIWIVILTLIIIWAIINIHCEIRGQCLKIEYVNISVLVIEMIGILYITLISRTPEVREMCLTPLYSFVRAKKEKEIYRSILMNIFMFVPFGILVPYIVKKNCKYKLQVTLLSASLLSSVIETLQYVFYLGRVEIDDVICNTLGAFIGSLSFVLYSILENEKRKIE